MFLDVVPVSASVPFFDHIARFREVGDDRIGGALGDVDAGGDISETCVGVAGNEQQRSGVVGEETPCCQHPTTVTGN